MFNMLKSILVLTLVSTSSFANLLEVEAFQSHEVNVKTMGYRLANRVFYQEKRKSQKECSIVAMDYGLMARSLFLNYNFQINIIDAGSKNSRGKRNTVQFKCRIEVQGNYQRELLFSKYLSFEKCIEKKDKLQENEKRLIVTNYKEKVCELFAL